jgi:Zn-dependent protease
MARFQGIPIHTITLFLFGGVSNIQRDPGSPSSEFLITVVGPLTSIGIGFLILFLMGVRIADFPKAYTAPQEAISELDPLMTLLIWFAPVNMLIGLFNLIPGFPLDGGRILRSILWKMTDNL